MHGGGRKGVKGGKGGFKVVCAVGGGRAHGEDEAVVGVGGFRRGGVVGGGVQMMGFGER